MSGETETNVSGWTTDTLNSFLQSLLGERDHRFEQRFEAQEEAVHAAFDSHEKWSRSEIEQLMRAIAAERDHVTGQIGMVRERLDAIDRATVLLNDQMTHFPTDVDKQVSHLKELHDEKFESIAQQFKERDTRSERESRDNKCVAADTPILCADLVWRPAGDLLVGDELIGFDAAAPPGNGGASGAASRGRMLRRAVVTANSLERDALLRVNTPRGSVRCTYDHPWLSRGPRPINHRWTWHWVRADELKPGDQVLHLFDVWDVDRSYEAGWLSGMIDGEGCLNFSSGDGTAARLGIVQRTSPTADRIHDALKARLDTFSAKERYPANERPPTAAGRQAENRLPVMTFTITMRADVMKILGSVRPERLLEHSDRVWEGRTITGKHRMTTVSSVEGAGSGMIASLSTSTETYIAGGFAMHNTAVEAAFAAQKEASAEQNKSNTLAISKSETATSETINKLERLFETRSQALADRIETSNKTLADKIDDMKERMNGIERSVNGAAQNRQGGQDAMVSNRANLASLVGLILLAIAIVGLYAKVG